MNIFTAFYINMNTNELIIRSIKFDFIDVSEKELFKIATDKAYEIKADNESFYKLEIIQTI